MKGERVGKDGVNPAVALILAIEDEKEREVKLKKYIEEETRKFGYIDEQIIQRFHFEPYVWKIGMYSGVNLKVYDTYTGKYLKDGRGYKGFENSEQAIAYLRAKYQKATESDSEGLSMKVKKKPTKYLYHFTDEEGRIDEVTVETNCPMHKMANIIGVAREIYWYKGRVGRDEIIPAETKTLLEKYSHDKKIDDYTVDCDDRDRLEIIRIITTKEGYTWEYPAKVVEY